MITVSIIMDRFFNRHRMAEEFTDSKMEQELKADFNLVKFKDIAVLLIFQMKVFAILLQNAIKELFKD